MLPLDIKNNNNYAIGHNLFLFWVLQNGLISTIGLYSTCPVCLTHGLRLVLTEQELELPWLSTDLCVSLSKYLWYVDIINLKKKFEME